VVIINDVEVETINGLEWVDLCIDNVFTSTWFLSRKFFNFHFILFLIPSSDMHTAGDYACILPQSNKV